MPDYRHVTTKHVIKNDFRYHPPMEGQADRYEAIRSKARNFALLLDKECPPSREKSLAMTKLEESVMWANAAIARNEKGNDKS